MKDMTRYEFGFRAAGRCIAWAGENSSSPVSKDEALELVQRILSILNLRIREDKDDRRMPCLGDH